MGLSERIKTARPIGPVVFALLAAHAVALTPAAGFSLTTESCFASGPLADDQVVGEAGIVALTLRATNPLTDGDGDFPSRFEMTPEDPESVPATLVVSFRDEQPGDLRWGARFSCTAETTNDNRVACSVADWCLDVGFDIVIEGDDAIDILVFPDSGVIGHLGDPCGSARRALTTPAQEEVTRYDLLRTVGDACR